MPCGKRKLGASTSVGGMAARGRERNVAKQVSTARKVGRVVKSVLKVAVALVLVALLCVGNIVVPSVISGLEMPRMINNILGYEQSWDNSGVDDDGLDLEYYKADYTSETIKDAERALDELRAVALLVICDSEHQDGGAP